jgi:hypothetical protein
MVDGMSLRQLESRSPCSNVGSPSLVFASCPLPSPCGTSAHVQKAEPGMSAPKGSATSVPVTLSLLNVRDDHRAPGGQRLGLVGTATAPAPLGVPFRHWEEPDEAVRVPKERC